MVESGSVRLPSGVLQNRSRPACHSICSDVITLTTLSLSYTVQFNHLILLPIELQSSILSSLEHLFR